MFRRKHARILKAHRNASVYVDGRYLHVDAQMSTQSKRGRELAREVASAILNEVGANEQAFQLLADNRDRASRGEAILKPEGEQAL